MSIKAYWNGVPQTYYEPTAADCNFIATMRAMQEFGQIEFPSEVLTVMELMLHGY